MPNVKYLILLLMMMAVTGGLVRYCAPEKVVYQTSDQDKKLDSLTTLTRSLKTSRSQLVDSLENTSKAFRQYVKKTGDDIAAYNRIIGQLNLTVDSLEESPGVALADLENLVDGQRYKDTTLTAISYFGDNLLKSTATGGIRSDSLFLDPPKTEQIRPVRIDQAISVSDDYSKVMVVTTSKDFSDLKVESVTELEAKKRFPWTEIIAVLSFLAGYLL